MKFAIVAITYSRPASLARLLNSLSQAHYGKTQLDLIISIDNSGKNDTKELADNFMWDFGEKIIKEHPVRLGLREHVFQCGDFLIDYDAIAVFEDDIYAAPCFFSFMQKAVDFYHDDDDIAGISLYNHCWSEYNSRPFTAMKGRHDVYFMQYAQSWGQVWMRKQWFDFKDWYLKKKSEPIIGGHVPDNVANWPHSSWLKYHIKYCVENKKYFVYPYLSLTTNFTDIGHHNDATSTTYQVPMNYGSEGHYVFSAYTRGGDVVIYDAFFERECIGNNLGIPDELLTVNLYGRKNPRNFNRYLLTMEIYDYKVVESFSLSLRPHEMNIIQRIHGDDIYLYDTSAYERNLKNADVDIAKWQYDVKAINYLLILKLLRRKIYSKLTPMEIWLSFKNIFLQRIYTCFIRIFGRSPS
jgi:hypothetical protein